MSFDIIDPADWDDEERKIQARRMAMYSIAAITAAKEVTRKYVIFPQLKGVLAAFDRIYQLSRQLDLPQGVLVSGPPGSSKSTVAKYFMKSLPPAADVVDGFGAIYMRMRPGASAGFIVSQVLKGLHHPFTNVRQDRVAPMRDIACEGLEHKGTRVLFIDEAQCLAHRGKRMAEERDTTAANLLRELADTVGVGIVLLADQRLQSLDQLDPGLADRLSGTLPLKHFEDGSIWAAFLGEFARTVKAVSLAVLTEDKVCAATHAATKGGRRAFIRLISEAVLIAVDDNASAVTVSHLRLAFERTTGSGQIAPNPYGSE
ncbi:MAG: TniB family NTP-binding protein [Pelomonas sp.]|nr:TniB family NTP-binding protein [Roseateles sp.]RTL33305.1 MAG: AAA family ATPase [Burkholderiales bacterium]